MIDNVFSIKEASKLLDCSTQNIYRQKSELIAKGLMEQSQSGSYFLNESGINYLKEKRIETIKSSQDLKQVANNNLSSVATSTIVDNAEIINILKQNIEDLKQEKEYWKNKFELKDQELSKLSEYLQEMNTTVFQKLLATEEQNRQQEKEIKEGVLGKFKRLFN